MADVKMTLPSGRKGRALRGVFVEERFLHLSLEAIGLAVHILALAEDVFSEDALRAMFPQYDLSGPLAELRAVGLIGEDEGTPGPKELLGGEDLDDAPLSGAGVIYIVEGGGRFKVGITKAMSPRLKSLQTGSPYQLRIVYSAHVPDSARAEYLAHSLLAKYRLHGEWFDCSEAEGLAMVRAAVDAVSPKAGGVRP